jgi:ADP-ribose pyrophosphatase YjhB (NUDIX family)
MKPGKIRALALGIFRKDDQILVFEGHDPVKDEAFYRPLGGTIEFGEYGPQALVREMREELDVEVAGVRYLGLCENIFTHAGKMGHEIVLLYEASITDKSVYEQEQLVGHELDGSPIHVVWKSLEFFRRGAAPLYPDGLLSLLDDAGVGKHEVNSVVREG